MKLFMIAILCVSAVSADYINASNELESCVRTVMADETGYEIDEWEATEFCRGVQ